MLDMDTELEMILSISVGFLESPQAYGNQLFGHTEMLLVILDFQTENNGMIYILR